MSRGTSDAHARRRAAAAVLCLLFAAVGASAEDAAVPSTEAAPPANPIVLWELATHDCHKSAEFFKMVFGWQANFAEDVQYYRLPIADGESQLSGGIIFTLAQAKLPFLTLYVLVDDIDAKAVAVTSAGGLITEPPHEISPGVSICLFNEPSGCTFAMIQIKPKE
jgi:predicted enzyme related to lactoylglutathione lyase